MKQRLHVVLLIGGFFAAACTTKNSEYNLFKDGANSSSDGNGIASDQGLKDLGNRDGSSKDVGLVDKNGADPKPDVFSCAPNTFIDCKTSSLLIQCIASGTGTVLIDCSPYICNAITKRCSQCDPNSAPYCQDNHLLSCSVDGLLVETPCPNGCLNETCISCSLKRYYRDADGDKFGNPSIMVNACAQPWGFVPNNLDCDDFDPAAHPGQTIFFNVPTKGTGNYDYNCDTIEEKEFSSPLRCMVSGMTCIGDGWFGVVPACGTNGVWANCNKQGGMPPACGIIKSNKIQSCH
ncbi:MAG: hypothetical protein ABIH46_12105 [Chloroflexota bacterium]